MQNPDVEQPVPKIGRTAPPVPQDTLLVAYEEALDKATTVPPGKHAARLLDLLVAREQIARTLSAGPPPPAATLAAFTTLDGVWQRFVDSAATEQNVQKLSRKAGFTDAFADQQPGYRYR